MYSEQAAVRTITWFHYLFTFYTAREKRRFLFVDCLAAQQSTDCLYCGCHIFSTGLPWMANSRKGCFKGFMTVVSFCSSKLLKWKAASQHHKTPAGHCWAGAVPTQTSNKSVNCDKPMSRPHYHLPSHWKQIMPIFSAILLAASGENNVAFHLYLYNYFTTKTLLQPGSPVTLDWKLTIYDNMAGGSLSSWKVWKATVWRCSMWSEKTCSLN